MTFAAVFIDCSDLKKRNAADAKTLALSGYLRLYLCGAGLIPLNENQVSLKNELHRQLYFPRVSYRAEDLPSGTYWVEGARGNEIEDQLAVL